MEERLYKIIPWNMSQKQADMNDALMKTLEKTPLGFFVR